MGPSRPVEGHYDRPMWKGFAEGNFLVQHCSQCGTVRYPPGPACPDCLSLDHEWCGVRGGGEILSWVRFHRDYFSDHPAPYNAVAVRLDEGPIVITNLLGDEPQGSWLGLRVRFSVVDRGGRLQHAVALEQLP
jgi:uncharacterized protein